MQHFSMIWLLCLAGLVWSRADAIGAEFRIIGYTEGTVALAPVGDVTAQAGDVLVVLEFDDDWFHEVGRLRITRIVEHGAIGRVISSPLPATLWMQKIAIPETAWDAETYQQWLLARQAERDRVEAALHPSPTPSTTSPRLRRTRVAAGVERAVSQRGRPQIWNRLGWLKWTMYAAGLGTTVAAVIYNAKAQDAWDEAEPGRSPAANARSRRDAGDFQEIRDRLGWIAAGSLASGVVLHEWEIFSRQRANTLRANLRTQMAAHGMGVGVHVTW